MFLRWEFYLGQEVALLERLDWEVMPAVEEMEKTEELVDLGVKGELHLEATETRVQVPVAVEMVILERTVSTDHGVNRVETAIALHDRVERGILFLIEVCEV